MKSSEAAYRLAGWLERYRPRTVILTVGVNNGRIRGVSPLETGPIRWVHSMRVHRLYRLLRTSMQTDRNSSEDNERPELQRMEAGDGWTVEQRDEETGRIFLRHQGNPLRRKPYTLASSLEILREDLASIHRQSAEFQACLILLTYAGFELAGRNSQLALETTATNEELRRFGRAENATLIDICDRFLRLLPAGVPRSELFLNDTESHPSPRGYREIALEIVGSMTAVDSESEELARD